MLLQRLNIILAASVTLDASGLTPQKPCVIWVHLEYLAKPEPHAERHKHSQWFRRLSPSVFYVCHVLLQVAVQGAKDSVDCSGVLRSTPVPVNGKRCHNPVYLSQLVSEKKTVP